MGLGADMMAEAIASEGYNDAIRQAAQYWRDRAEDEDKLSLALFSINQVDAARNALARRDGFRRLAAQELLRLE